MVNSLDFGETAKALETLQDQFTSIINEVAERIRLDNFKESLDIIKASAKRIGASDMRFAEYNIIIMFTAEDVPNIVRIFERMKEDGTHFQGKWGIAANGPEDLADDGIICFELQRDYIEFKLRTE